MSADLVAWLRVQIDADEAYARNAFGDHNAAAPDWDEQWSGCLNIGDGEDLVLTNDSQVSRFMARFDPARILREVDMKRSIVAEHAPVVDGSQSSWAWFQGSESKSEQVLKMLALLYVDQPGFRDEWRPE